MVDRELTLVELVDSPCKLLLEELLLTLVVDNELILVELVEYVPIVELLLTLVELDESGCSGL